MLKNMLNLAQIEAVTAMGAPLLVVAGAGSGKTRVITCRIAHLIQQGALPWNILAVTFTNKAAGEMKSRVQNMLGENISLNIGTFHSICVRILRVEAEKIGLKPNFVIYDESDQRALIKKICKDLKLSNKTYRPQDIASKISSAKNQLLNAHKFTQQADNYYDQIVAKVYHSYEKKMCASNAVDFDDIILQAVALLQKDTEILQKYRNKFQHILIDEYQDTNHAQYKLIRLLAGDGRNLSVVGDPDQSIYRWRGADITNILKFEEDYKNVKVIRLEQNYRSTQNILSAANGVIRHNQRRKHKNLWSENGHGDLVNIYHLDSELSEANFAVKMLQNLKEINNFKFSDMAIFYRTHAQSRVFEEALRFAGISYDIVGGISFYDRKEIKDIIAYLSLIACPDNEVSMLRIINIPSRGIGTTAINMLGETAKKTGKTFTQVVWDSVSAEEIPHRILEKVRRFALLLIELRKMTNTHDIAQLINVVIDKIKYFDELKKEEKVLAEIRIENVKELVSAAKDFALTHDNPTLLQFLETVALVTSVDLWKAEEDKVTLMTVHSAKGLEFKAVIMAGMEEGLFPHASSMNDPEELEEERRLCYVGMTRAKEKLIMCHTHCRMLYGRRTYRVPSQFLSEIPQEQKQINLQVSPRGRYLPHIDEERLSDVIDRYI